MSLQHLTESIGRELNLLNGLRSTRVKAGSSLTGTTIDFGVPSRERPRARWERDSNGATAVSASEIEIALDGRLSIATAIAGGQTFRGTDLLDGDLTAAVVARTSGTEIEVAPGTFSTRHRNMTWEVFTGTNTVEVETTVGFPDVGKFGTTNSTGDAMVFSYSGKTATSFTGVRFFNGSLWTQQLPGSGYLVHVESPFSVGREIVDINRSFNALDLVWRSATIQFAEGEDLARLAMKYGHRRPAGGSDAMFRELLRVVALMPHGSMWSVETFFNALYGVGGYELFEDCTSHGQNRTRVWSDPYTPVVVNHPAILFLNVVAFLSSSEGKTFLEDSNFVYATTSTDVPLPTAPTLDTYDITYAEEGGEVQVLAGTNDCVLSWVSGPPQFFVLTSSGTPFLTGVTVDGTVGTTDMPQVGDDVYVDFGRGFIRLGQVYERVSTSVLRVGMHEAATRLEQPATTIGAVARWKITRTSTDLRRSRWPAEDMRAEDPADPAALRQFWWWEGAGSAAETDYTPAATGLDFDQTLNDAPSAWVSSARVLPSTTTSLTVLFRPWAASTEAGAVAQFGAVISDGARAAAFGIRQDGAGDIEIGLCTSTGFITSTDPSYAFGGPRPYGSTVEVRLEKIGQQQVRLYVDGRLVHACAYTDCGASAYGLFASGGNYRAVGRCAAANSSIPTQVNVEVRRISWTSSSHHALVNVYDTSASVAVTDQVTSAAGVFTAGMVGSYLRLDAQELAPVLPKNSIGGSAIGMWRISAYTSPTQVTVDAGPECTGLCVPYEGALVLDLTRSPLVFPDALGHTIELLDGMNAGAQLRIDALLREDGTPITPTSLTAIRERHIAHEHASFVQVTILSGATVLSGAVDVRWRLLPNFAAGGSYEVQVIDQAVYGASITLAQVLSLPLYVPGPLVSPYTGLATVVPAGKGPLLKQKARRVRSATVTGPLVRNATNGGPGYDYYPFYLWSPLGWAAPLLRALLPIGTHIDTTSFYRNTTGRHLR